MSSTVGDKEADASSSSESSSEDSGGEPTIREHRTMDKQVVDGEADETDSSSDSEDNDSNMASGSYGGSFNYFGQNAGGKPKVEAADGESSSDESDSDASDDQEDAGSFLNSTVTQAAEESASASSSDEEEELDGVDGRPAESTVAEVPAANQEQQEVVEEKQQHDDEPPPPKLVVSSKIPKQKKAPGRFARWGQMFRNTLSRKPKPTRRRPEPPSGKRSAPKAANTPSTSTGSGSSTKQAPPQVEKQREATVAKSASKRGLVGRFSRFFTGRKSNKPATNKAVKPQRRKTPRRPAIDIPQSAALEQAAVGTQRAVLRKRTAVADALIAQCPAGGTTLTQASKHAVAMARVHESSLDDLLQSMHNTKTSLSLFVPPEQRNRAQSE